jgi:tRNA (guanine-N7-)-methyltransferase
MTLAIDPEGVRGIPSSALRRRCPLGRPDEMRFSRGLVPTIEPPPTAPAEAPRPIPPEGALLVRPDIMQRLDFTAMFGDANPVEVELGAGDGSFIARYAASNPGRNFLGIERLLGRLRKIDRKGRRGGLTNLRGMRIEAAYLLEWMVPPNSVAAIHIYFPDPWPKRRHWKHRLINERFTSLVHRALAPDGTVFLRTDEATYFAQMERVFDADKGFARISEPPELLAVATDFEREFNARGIATNHVAYRRLG